MTLLFFMSLLEASSGAVSQNSMDIISALSRPVNDRHWKFVCNEVYGFVVT